MKKLDGAWAALFVAWFVMAILCSSVKTELRELKDQAIAQGCAIYTDTGEFAWLDEVTTGTMKRKGE